MPRPAPLHGEADGDRRRRCSTRGTFTGQTVSCNGGPQATAGRQITIARASPPVVKITNSQISSKRHTATFTFKALAAASGFQCAPIKQPNMGHKPPKPNFSRCKSPITYKQLKHGKYTFEVRALNAAGSGKPDKKTFAIL